MNPVNYSALEHLAFAPRSGGYYATGSPLRLSAECKVVTPNAPHLRALFQKRARRIRSLHTGTFQKNGALFDLADVYFANGLLDDVELARYQKELREFSSLLQRTVVLHNCRWKGEYRLLSYRYKIQVQGFRIW